MKRDEMNVLARDPLNPANAEVAARVYADGALWPEFEEALYGDVTPTADERQVIGRFVADRCGDAEARRRAWLRDIVSARLARIAGDTSDFALAAANGKSPRPDAASSASADDPVTFVFVSESGAGAGWRAELTLPAKARVDEMLPISLSDAAGDPLDAGVFRIAGVALPVAAGRAEIPYGMFLSGLKDAHVEFIDDQGGIHPGTLALMP